MEVKSATEQKSLLNTIAPGKRARLHRLLFEFGPGNGTLLLLPIDQGIEHGPRDFFANPASKDPEYQFRLAVEAGYSALACQIGLAEKYYPDYAGQVPLILKVNGKTDVPPSDQAFSTTNSSVEDAVRLGADAVGYTMYLGSPRRETVDELVGRIREAAQVVPLDRLALSPQCGFATSVIGNALSIDDQRAKLRTIADAAAVAWP
jgi:class I fructose-bisphosphate aldolase